MHISIGLINSLYSLLATTCQIILLFSTNWDPLKLIWLEDLPLKTLPSQSFHPFHTHLDRMDELVRQRQWSTSNVSLTNHTILKSICLMFVISLKCPSVAAFSAKIIKCVAIAIRAKINVTRHCMGLADSVRFGIQA